MHLPVEIVYQIICECVLMDIEELRQCYTPKSNVKAMDRMIIKFSWFFPDTMAKWSLIGEFAAVIATRELKHEEDIISREIKPLEQDRQKKLKAGTRYYLYERLPWMVSQEEVRYQWLKMLQRTLERAVRKVSVSLDMSGEDGM